MRRFRCSLRIGLQSRDRNLASLTTQLKITVESCESLPPFAVGRLSSSQTGSELQPEPDETEVVA